MELPTLQTITEAVDFDRALAWLCRAIETPSVTGDESAFAEMVAETFRPFVDMVHVEEVAPGRPLVWTRTYGRGVGPTVLLAAHLDTVPPSRETDPYAAILDGNQLRGLGAADDKAAIAVTASALETLHYLGALPAGDVITLFVPDEESGVPGTGRSIGMRRAAELIAGGTIPRPDFAIYGEPSNLDLYCAQPGFFIGTVTIHGRAAYWSDPEDGIDAIGVGHAVYASLRKLSRSLAARPPHPTTVRPLLQGFSFTGGGDAPAIPAECVIKFIRTLVPGEDLDQAANEIQTLVADTISQNGASAIVEFTDGRDHRLGGLPSFTLPDTQPVAALLAAVRAVVPEAKIAAAAYWSEKGFLTALGIPAVYWGAGDIRNCHTPREHLDLAAFEAAVRALALFLATPHTDLI
jgi:acetylornithine deacetylase